MFRLIVLSSLLALALLGCGKSTTARTTDVTEDPRNDTTAKTCVVQFAKSSIDLGESVLVRVLENNSPVQATLSNGTVVSPSGSSLSPMQTTTLTANTGASQCSGTITVVVPKTTATVTNPCLKNPSLPSCKLLVSPTADKIVTVVFNYVCSTIENRSYIEDSSGSSYPITNPIVTLETNVANLTGTASRSASQLDATYYVSGTRYLKKDPKTHRLEIPLKYDVDPLRQWYANLKLPTTQWEGDFVGVLVGDDKGKNWSLVDDFVKNARNSLNGGGRNAIPGFLAKRPPGRIVVDVFQGRGITKKDPRFAKYCHSQSSPLVLDLNGDGIKLSNAQPGNVSYEEVVFDIDGDGVKEHVGWVASADDVLLVRDRNGNGKIDSGRELFGNHTLLASGEEAANGFEALKEMDSNGDGEITRADRDWNTLKVWMDGTPNVGKGMSHATELFSLDDAGIESIQLDYMQVAESDGYNQTRQRAIFKHRMGTQVFNKQIADIWFEVGD